MNKEISFEIAKLLKEKGFPFPQKETYYNPVNGFSSYEEINPTIAEVVMWLYEKHGIWIQPYQTDDNNDAYPLFWNEINNRGKIIESTKFGNWFNSPTEAYEAAIEYTLNNLI